jgi:hypothetical protein
MRNRPFSFSLRLYIYFFNTPDACALFLCPHTHTPNASKLKNNIPPPHTQLQGPPKHPNIVPVIGVALDGGAATVTPLAPGGSLAGTYE